MTRQTPENFPDAVPPRGVREADAPSPVSPAGEGDQTPGGGNAYVPVPSPGDQKRKQQRADWKAAESAKAAAQRRAAGQPVRRRKGQTPPAARYLGFRRLPPGGAA
jgi:hypothetical protein